MYTVIIYPALESGVHHISIIITAFKCGIKGTQVYYFQLCSFLLPFLSIPSSGFCSHTAWGGLDSFPMPAHLFAQLISGGYKTEAQ